MGQWLPVRVRGGPAPAAVRRHEAGADDFAARLHGATGARRRCAGASSAGSSWTAATRCWCTSGMSGQLLMQPAGRAGRGPPAGAVAAVRGAGGPGRARAALRRPADVRRADPHRAVRTRRRAAARRRRPGGRTGRHRGSGRRRATSAATCSTPTSTWPRVLTRLRRRRSGIKRALLDQQLVSGVGNIYADEALWRARLHGEHPADELRPAAARQCSSHAATVMREALGPGRHELRQPLRRRERQPRVLHAVAVRLRSGGAAVPAVRHAASCGSRSSTGRRSDARAASLFASRAPLARVNACSH